MQLKPLNLKPKDKIWIILNISSASYISNILLNFFSVNNLN